MPAKRKANILTDTPKAWLVQLFRQHLDNDNKICVFGVCQKLNEATMKHSQSTMLNLELLERPLSTAVKLLQAASSHAADVRLKLYHAFDGGWWWQRTDRDETFQQMGSAVCSLLETASGPGPMCTVTNLHLEHAWLDTILPPVISQACPNLTKIILQECFIGWDSAVNVIQNFHNLHSLELRDILFEDRLEISGRLESKYDTPEARSQAEEETKAHWRHLGAQLAGLPALQSLTLVRTMDNNPDSWDPVHGYEDYVPCWDVLGAYDLEHISQLVCNLTHLHWDVVCCESIPWRLDWGPLGARLQHLRLPGTKLGDHHLRQLLTWPCLTHLEVDFRLEESHAGQACKWQELKCTTMTVTTLARLPLHPGLLLKVADRWGSDLCPTYFYLYDTAANVAQQAINNLGKCNGVVWDERGVTLKPFHSKYNPDALSTEPDKFSEAVIQALPILSSARAISVDGGHLNRAAMQALIHSWGSRGDKLCIVLEKECSWKTEDVVLLVEGMPSNSTLKLSAPNSEPLLVQLCCAVKRKVQLVINLDLFHPEFDSSGARASVLMQKISSCMQSHSYQSVDGTQFSTACPQEPSFSLSLIDWPPSAPMFFVQAACDPCTSGSILQ